VRGTGTLNGSFNAVALACAHSGVVLLNNFFLLDDDRRKFFGPPMVWRGCEWVREQLAKFSGLGSAARYCAIRI
jgi:hypothetical protein